MMKEIFPNLKSELRHSREYFNKHIETLQFRLLLCDETGWWPWISQETREWFTSRWPDYTQKKDIEQDIYSWQRDLWWRGQGPLPSAPRHINICPCTIEIGKEVNQKFEEVSGA